MRINLKYADVGMFIERYAVNISRGGVFIPARSPKEVGALVRFEFLLAGGTPVLRGEGQVIWVKPYDPEQPRRVHGMGLRFTRLDPESRQVLDRVLAWKREHQQESGETTTEEGVSAVVAEPSLPNVQSLPPSPLQALPTLQALPPLPKPTPAPPTLAPLPTPPPSLVTPMAPLQAQDEAPTPAPVERAEAEQREAVAELWQASQSQVIRAARTIAVMTVAQHYYPEDTVLEELLRPLRIPLPASDEDAVHLLRDLLARGRWAEPNW